MNEKKKSFTAVVLTFTLVEDEALGTAPGTVAPAQTSTPAWGKITAIQNAGQPSDGAATPVDGATILVGDLTSPLVIERIASTLDGKADVVLCDGAPDVLDLGDVDAHLQLSLCRAALACARTVLAQGGSFVCKIYRDATG